MRYPMRSSEAVSPVVGVMLMLVVTIIIAAVVSGFAGGLISGVKATPQVLLTGTFSQTNGMTITNSGGDAVSLSMVTFVTVPGDSMGPDTTKFTYPINKTIIQDPANNNLPIYNSSSGVYNTNSFSPGQTLVITHANSIDYSSSSVKFQPWYVNYNAATWWASGTSNSKGQYLSSYEFCYPGNVGKYFYVEMLDSTGSIVGQAKVTITG